MDKNEKKWHKRYMKQAEDVATWSKAHRTRVGAVIIDDNRSPRNNGYNGFPRKVRKISKSATNALTNTSTPNTLKEMRYIIAPITV